MTPLIKQLAEQAGGTQKYVPAPGVWQFFDDELEKFVELIVTECAHAAMNNETDIENPMMLAGRAQAHKQILKLFTTGENNGKSASSNQGLS